MWESTFPRSNEEARRAHWTIGTRNKLSKHLCSLWDPNWCALRIPTLFTYYVVHLYVDFYTSNFCGSCILCLRGTYIRTYGNVLQYIL